MLLKAYLYTVPLIPKLFICVLNLTWQNHSAQNRRKRQLDKRLRYTAYFQLTIAVERQLCSCFPYFLHVLSVCASLLVFGTRVTQKCSKLCCAKYWVIILYSSAPAVCFCAGFRQFCISQCAQKAVVHEILWLNSHPSIELWGQFGGSSVPCFGPARLSRFSCTCSRSVFLCCFLTLLHLKKLCDANMEVNALLREIFEFDSEPKTVPQSNFGAVWGRFLDLRVCVSFLARFGFRHFPISRRHKWHKRYSKSSVVWNIWVWLGAKNRPSIKLCLSFIGGAQNLLREQYCGSVQPFAANISTSKSKQSKALWPSLSGDFKEGGGVAKCPRFPV